MASHRHQFCPIAKAAEILCERWTLLVVRELLLGSRHFNDFHRGLPMMSPALLTKRLRSLEEAGVLVRVDTGRGVEYRLTLAGEELRPMVRFAGHWGARWVRSQLSRDELDAGSLMWDDRCANDDPDLPWRHEFPDRGACAALKASRRASALNLPNCSRRKRLRGAQNKASIGAHAIERGKDGDDYGLAAACA